MTLFRPVSPFVSIAIAVGVATSAWTQEREGNEVSPGEISVLATRLKGSVDTELPPVATFDEADIAALGLGSLQELLGAIGPQTGSGRGRGGGEPVVLLNALRVSGFRELRGLPAEAIRKVEVLPEELALKYGFRPNQRVVNFIMKDDFRSFTADLEARAPDRGGFFEQELEASFAKIASASRLNVTAKVLDNSTLTETERGIVQLLAVGPIRRRSSVIGLPNADRRW